MAARALRAARRPLSLLAACGFLMSTLALGLYKIRGAWPRPPSLGLRPIHLVSPDFMKVGAIAPTFYLMRAMAQRTFSTASGPGKRRQQGAYGILYLVVHRFRKKVVFSTGVNRKTTGFSTTADLSTDVCPHCPQNEKTKFQRMRQEKTPVSDKTAKKRRAS